MDPFPLGPFSVARIGFGAMQLPGRGVFGPPRDRDAALAWTLRVAPNVLLIPGTSSVQHLEENLAVADIELDDETREQLNAVAA